jgi:hypothetical protein
VKDQFSEVDKNLISFPQRMPNAEVTVLGLLFQIIAAMKDKLLQ